jgi:hypothetical protein
VDGATRRRHMSGDDSRAVKDDLPPRERLGDAWVLERATKFRTFFAGLVFALLSFSVQFSVQTSTRRDWCQFLAWTLLLITGCLALRDAGGFTTRDSDIRFEGLRPGMRRIMWMCFLVGVVLLVVMKIPPLS